MASPPATCQGLTPGKGDVGRFSRPPFHQPQLPIASAPPPGSRAAAGHTFHVEETVEIRQRDTAVHRIPPVRKLVVRIKPRIEVLFTVFKLNQGEEREPAVSQKDQKRLAQINTEKIKVTDKEAIGRFVTIQWSVVIKRIQNYEILTAGVGWSVDLRCSTQDMV